MKAPTPTPEHQVVSSKDLAIFGFSCFMLGVAALSFILAFTK